MIYVTQQAENITFAGINQNLQQLKISLTLCTIDDFDVDAAITVIHTTMCHSKAE